MSLVITRKRNESLRIGDAIVEVHRIAGHRVSLRIIAPPEVKIMRTEIEAKNSPLAVQSNAFVPMNAPTNGGCFAPGHIEAS